MLFFTHNSAAILIGCIFSFTLNNSSLACDEPATCGDHGTAVVFEQSPAEAARKALEAEKLVFVLHVSGNFETPNYT